MSSIKYVSVKLIFSFLLRLSTEHSTAAHVEYFTKKFTEPQNDLEGLKSVRTALGLAVVADVSSMGR